MGMWEGILHGVEATEARQDKKDKIERERLLQEKVDAQYNEGMRLKKLDLVMKYRKNKGSGQTVSVQDMAKEIKTLQTIGLPEDVSMFLVRSGESKGIIKAYDKLGKDKPPRVYFTSLIEKVRSALGDKATPQALAMAAITSLDSDENLGTTEGQETAFQEAFFEALYDSSIDPMSLLNFKQQPIIDVPAIGDLTRGMQPVDLSQIKNIKNLVSSRLATEFGAVFTTDSEGNVRITDYGKSADQPQAVNQIIDDTVTYITNNIQGVNAAPVNTAINDAVQQVIDLQNVYKVPVVRIPDYTFDFSKPSAPFKPTEESQPVETPEDGLKTGQDIFNDPDFK
jgi:hypothetical protein